MPKSHLSPHAIEVTRTFVQAGLVGIIGVVSLIAAATLIYAWFFT